MSSYKQIYQSGYELFAKYGYRNVSVSQIATKAWVAKGSFYNSFDSKQQLYIEILENIFDSIEKYMLFLKDRFDDLEERFYNYLYGGCLFYEDNSIVFNLIKQNKLYYSSKVDKAYVFDKIKKAISNLFTSDELDKLNQKGINMIDIVLVAKSFILLISNRTTHSQPTYEEWLDKYIRIVTKWLFDYDDTEFEKLDYDTIKDVSDFCLGE